MRPNASSRETDGGPDLRVRPRSTSFVASSRLNDVVGVEITLASEIGQHTGSFKFRGAFNTAGQTDASHLIAASSGNFGQALAYACRLHGRRCTVVMPIDAMPIKVEAVRRHGAAVDFVNTAVTPRQARVAALMAEHPDAVQVFPSHGEWMLAGNETLGAEILAHVPAFDVVVAPVGGGGVVVGLMRARARLGASAAIVAAEPLVANDLARSLREGRRIVLDGEPATLADGVRVNVSEPNWPIIRDGVAGVVEVDEPRIAEAVRLLHETTGLEPEPTAALAVAAVMTDPARFAGRRVCCVVTGGNIDPDVFRTLVGRA